MHTLPVPESDLPVATGHDHVVALGEERDGAGIEAEVLLVADGLCLLASLDGVKRELLVPGARHEQVVGSLELLGTEGEGPDWALALANGEELSARLVPDQDCSVVEADCQKLSIWRPVARNTLGRGLGLVDALTV